jgi:hypothetical protein
VGAALIIVVRFGKGGLLGLVDRLRARLQQPPRGPGR